MSVQICDANDCLGQLASNAGYQEFVDYVKHNGGPALVGLVNEGYAQKRYIVSDISDVLDRDMPDTVREVVETLEQLVAQADEIVIVSEA